jgi:hypothetical protein
LSVLLEFFARIGLVEQLENRQFYQPESPNHLSITVHRFASCTASGKRQLMIQQVLHKPQWQSRVRSENLRALTPLIYSHVTPYGRFRLDMTERLVIETAVAA